MDQSGKRTHSPARRSTGGKAPRKCLGPKEPRWTTLRAKPGHVDAETQTRVETSSSNCQTYSSTSDAQTQTRDPPTMVTTQSQTRLTVRNPDAFHD